MSLLDQNDHSISLNKYISDTGHCSRREADKLIAAGQVQINGVTARLGNRVSPGDEVRLNGVLITSQHKPPALYIMLNKPVGITCTTDQSIPGNIIDHIGYPERIFPIGRLDKPSQGLILLTNDGDIVNKILRAGNQHEKEYIVSVNRPLTQDFLQQMANGVSILDTITQPCTVEQLGKHTFRIILTQGLNRQIRRMCSHLGYEVSSLQRTRIMHIRLGKLQPGQWRPLTTHETNILLEKVRHSSKIAP